MLLIEETQRPLLFVSRLEGETVREIWKYNGRSRKRILRTDLARVEEFPSISCFFLVQSPSGTQIAFLDMTSQNGRLKEYLVTCDLNGKGLLRKAVAFDLKDQIYLAWPDADGPVLAIARAGRLAIQRPFAKTRQRELSSWQDSIWPSRNMHGAQFLGDSHRVLASGARLPIGPFDRRLYWTQEEYWNWRATIDVNQIKYEGRRKGEARMPRGDGCWYDVRLLKFPLISYLRLDPKRAYGFHADQLDFDAFVWDVTQAEPFDLGKAVCVLGVSRMSTQIRASRLTLSQAKHGK